MSGGGVLIRGGTIVTPEREGPGDVRSRDGQIVEVGPSLARQPGEEVVEAGGCLVIPGGVDPHVHLALRVAGTVSADDFESGTAAALAGGTTTVIDFVHPERGEDFLDALAARREEAVRAVADYGLHMAVTWWGPETAGWMRRCVQEEGVSSFKAYMAYRETVGIDDEDLLRVLQTVSALDALLLVHAEVGDRVEELRRRFAEEGKLHPRYHARSRPPEVEGDATERVARFAAAAAAELYVVHVTCRQAVEAIAGARAVHRGIHGETCPQYLLLDDSAYEGDFEAAAACVMAPPLRPPEHREALWAALAAGDLETVATDHCPFTRRQKRAGAGDFRLIPGGAPGVEHRLSLLYTHGVAEGRIDRRRFVDLVSTRPARLFGLYPRKGAIAVGSDADLVVWDPAATAVLSAATHYHRCDQSVYEGMPVRGLPAVVVAAGRVRCRAGELSVDPGAGRFLRRGR